MREMNAKTEEAMAAIRDAEATKWKSELADVFVATGVIAVHVRVDE